MTDPIPPEGFDPSGDGAHELHLRPSSLAEFVGQAQVKEHLSIVLEAARRRAQPVDHLLFAGPPGLGKTSLAGIVANEMGAGLRITSGPTLERAGDVASILNGLNEGDVLFIDEIHRIPRAVEEVLYSAMEDFQLDIMLGKGPTARSIRLELPKFTLVGATTRAGLLSGPLYARFGHVARLDYYRVEDLQAIIERAAGILDVEIVTDGAYEIARRSRGTPRIANRLLRRVRDYAEVRADGVITFVEAKAGLTVFDIDDIGLDRVDRAILTALCNRGGDPIGLSTLAIMVGEAGETVEEVYEPYLIQMGFLRRTPRGRVATEEAWRHLGLAVPERAKTLLEALEEDLPSKKRSIDRTLFDDDLGNAKDDAKDDPKDSPKNS
jgi:holliday junction DNA helicase RuvB